MLLIIRINKEWRDSPQGKGFMEVRRREDNSRTDETEWADTRLEEESNGGSSQSTTSSRNNNNDGETAVAKRLREVETLLKTANANLHSQAQRSKKIDPKKPPGPQRWNIGDFCRATCDFDGQDHEAEILKQNPEDLKERKDISLMKESLGETARQNQVDEQNAIFISNPKLGPTVPQP